MTSVDVRKNWIMLSGWYKDLDQVRKDAMINLCFNLGISRLRKFKLALRAMEVKDYEDAADEFLGLLVGYPSRSTSYGSHLYDSIWRILCLK
jgi:GH24 family phage-related lysozyme (muramidase)